LYAHVRDPRDECVKQHHNSARDTDGDAHARADDIANANAYRKSDAYGLAYA
jgi:hypothetical protein